MIGAIKSDPRQQFVRNFGGNPCKKRAQHFVFSKVLGIYLATSYSHRTCRPTTIGAAAFHFRVRNGTGWFHRALVTRIPPSRKVCQFSVFCFQQHCLLATFEGGLLGTFSSLLAFSFPFSGERCFAPGLFLPENYTLKTDKLIFARSLASTWRFFWLYRFPNTLFPMTGLFFHVRRFLGRSFSSSKTGIKPNG